MRWLQRALILALALGVGLVLSLVVVSCATPKVDPEPAKGILARTIDRVTGAGVHAAGAFGSDPSTAQTTIWAFAPVAAVGGLLMLGGGVMFFFDKRESIKTLGAGMALCLLASIFVGMLKHPAAPWVFGFVALVGGIYILLTSAIHVHRKNGSDPGWWPFRIHRHRHDSEHSDLLEDLEEKP